VEVSLKQSYQACRRVTAQASSTFYLASLLFQTRTRHDIQALYAFCRIADDIADSADLNVAQKRTQIGAMRKGVTEHKLPAVEPEIWPAFWQVIERYSLPQKELLDVLEGVESDIVFTQPRTVNDLDRYSYYVAGVVGILSARILGVTSKNGFEAAKNLGIAMQYTNIIRDVASDSSLKRTYIPTSILKKYRITQDISSADSSEFRQAVAELCQRADDFYDKAEPGLMEIPAKHRKPVRVAFQLYRGILERVKQKQYNVNIGRIRLNRLSKLQVVWRVYTGQ
jgi:phytoene synthase